MTMHPSVEERLREHPRLHQQYWASYIGTAQGSSIGLHDTRRAALEEIAGVIWGSSLNTGADDTPHAEQTDDELEEAISDHCDTGADDWCVQEVETP